MERKHVLQAYGAEMVFSDPGEGSDGAIRLCREIYKEDPDRYFYPDQYNNPANWKAHYEGTAMEILEQTGGSITHFVLGTGVCGLVYIWAGLWILLVMVVGRKLWRRRGYA